MSGAYLDQDWETDTNATDGTPMTLSAGTALARSATNAIDGTDLRGGNNTAADGLGLWLIPATKQRYRSGLPGGGARIEAYAKIKKTVTPSGGLLTVLGFTGDAALNIRIANGGTVLRVEPTGVLAADAALAGTTALGTGAHEMLVLYREEASTNGAGNTGLLGWTRVYLDGLLELERRGHTKIGALSGVTLGVGANNKCTWDFTWGRLRCLLSRDPQ